jgi:hypothetical protein
MIKLDYLKEICTLDTIHITHHNIKKRHNIVKKKNTKKKKYLFLLIFLKPMNNPLCPPSPVLSERNIAFIYYLFHLAAFFFSNK